VWYCAHVQHASHSATGFEWKLKIAVWLAGARKSSSVQFSATWRAVATRRWRSPGLARSLAVLSARLSSKQNSSSYSICRPQHRRPAPPQRSRMMCRLSRPRRRSPGMSTIFLVASLYCAIVSSLSRALHGSPVRLASLNFDLTRLYTRTH